LVLLAVSVVPRVGRVKGPLGGRSGRHQDDAHQADELRNVNLRNKKKIEGNLEKLLYF
jgi:hypothetical protein